MITNNASNTTSNHDDKLLVTLTPMRNALVADDNETLDVLVRLSAPAASHDAITRSNRKRLALAIVLDGSGSMEGAKFREAKRCTQDLVDRLNDDDIVSVTIYDETALTLFKAAPAHSVRSDLRTVLANLEPDGGTDLHGGWLAGASTLAPLTQPSNLCRVVLLSDGQANSGITSSEAICAQVSQLAQAGITTTTVGLGEDFNEDLMTQIAAAGNGNAWYGERAEDLAEAFTTELGVLQALAYSDVKVKIISQSKRWSVLNKYLKNAAGQYQLTSVAQGSEAWMAISLEMPRALMAQAEGKLLTLVVTAKNSRGETMEWVKQLPILEILGREQYNSTPKDALVSKRFQEVRCAELQDSIRDAVKRGDRRLAKRQLVKLEQMAQGNEWILRAIENFNRLLELGEDLRLSKEMSYNVNRINTRLSSPDEAMEDYYSMEAELNKPLFLRRKIEQGRRSDTADGEV